MIGPDGHQRATSVQPCGKCVYQLYNHVLEQVPNCYLVAYLVANPRSSVTFGHVLTAIGQSGNNCRANIIKNSFTHLKYLSSLTGCP